MRLWWCYHSLSYLVFSSSDRSSLSQRKAWIKQKFEFSKRKDVKMREKSWTRSVGGIVQSSLCACIKIFSLSLVMLIRFYVIIVPKNEREVQTFRELSQHYDSWNYFSKRSHITHILWVISYLSISINNQINEQLIIMNFRFENY